MARNGAVFLPALLKELEGRIREAGSLRAFARLVGVSPAHVSDIMHGRREPGPKLLDRIGWRKDVVIRRVVKYRRLSPVERKRLEDPQ